ncbi:hypothetical protein CSIRO_2890 [Bradyrhizobiaceae bacterium SG-6C]|nr:hypothetical protein CSIRO_2890 [Bradyrhizobiaceae bacterium SG-6C]
MLRNRPTSKNSDNSAHAVCNLQPPNAALCTRITTFPPQQLLRIETG